MPTGVSIIIASHNTRAHLERCLSALGDAHQLIVVDTASTDGSQGLVRRSFPHVRLIQLDSNPGYGGALNEGIAHASGTDLLLMNADAWPLADAVDNLVQFAEGEPRAGIVGPAPQSGREPAGVSARLPDALATRDRVSPPPLARTAQSRPQRVLRLLFRSPLAA